MFEGVIAINSVRYLPGHIGVGTLLTSLFSALISVYYMHSAVPNTLGKTNRRAHLLSRNSDFRNVDTDSLLALKIPGTMRCPEVRTNLAEGKDCW